MQFNNYSRRGYIRDDGKNCTRCCDLESVKDPECAANSVFVVLGLGITIVVCAGLLFPILYQIIRCFCDCVKTCCNKFCNTSSSCCKPQSIARRCGTERSTTYIDNYGISTISADLRQAPRPIVSKTPIAPA